VREESFSSTSRARRLTAREADMETREAAAAPRRMMRAAKRTMLRVLDATAASMLSRVDIARTKYFSSGMNAYAMKRSSPAMS